MRYLLFQAPRKSHTWQAFRRPSIEGPAQMAAWKPLCKSSWLLTMILLLGIGSLIGCAGFGASVKPPSLSSRNSSSEDAYEGWLFRSLTGKAAKKSEKAQLPTSSTASGEVRQTSAVLPEPQTVGPLVPGPSSSAWRQPGSRTSPAGPPPTIPPELPPPPEKTVSITETKQKAEEKKGFELSDLAPENIYKNLKKAAGYGPNEKIARAAMEEGRQLFREKKYKEAAEKFAVAAARWPDSPLEEDALFLKGESEFFADLYSKAHDTYGGLLKKYSNTRHLDTVAAREFAIGRYWEQKYTAHPTWPITPNLTDSTKPLFDTFGYAVQAYERVRQYDPTGPLADDSLMALANAYFRRGRYEEAAYNYDLLRREYPNSEHQMNAHILGLQAKMRVYQGTLYDGTPLKESAELSAQLLRQYGSKLGEEHERIARTHAQIVEELANREFARGEYYRQKKYYGAARIYYQSVIDEYPGTEKAKEAKARLEELRGLPDEPPKKFAWLTEMFE